MTRTRSSRTSATTPERGSRERRRNRTTNATLTSRFRAADGLSPFVVVVVLVVVAIVVVVIVVKSCTNLNGKSESQGNPERQPNK